jgi:hypothetical protein
MIEAQTGGDEKPFCASRAQFEALVERLESSAAMKWTHSELERWSEVQGRELMRRLFQDHLDLRAQREPKRLVTGADGVARKWHRQAQCYLETLFGTVTVTRTQYERPGVASLHPLDAELNLPPELYSYGVQRRVVYDAAQLAYDSALARLAQATGAAVPKRQMEALVQRAACDFEAFYAQRSAPPSETTGHLLVLSCDGKGVVMRTPGLRPATQRAAQQQDHKLTKRLSRGEKRHRKRMATVATVYTLHPEPRTAEEVVFGPPGNSGKRPRPESKRVWASLEQDPAEVIAAAFDEGQRRDPQLRKQWVAVVDGNEPQLDRLEAEAAARGIYLYIVLDLIHVLEYLWKAVYAFHPEGSKEAEAWVTERLYRLLHGQSSQVAAGMRRSATQRELSPEQRAPVDTCANYLLKYAPYLRYDLYLAVGFPIASGVIEGACRHLIQDRLGVTGARWSLKGAESVLRLRSLISSGDFEEYWDFHERQEFERNHASRYAESHGPKLASILDFPADPHVEVA